MKKSLKVMALSLLFLYAAGTVATLNLSNNETTAYASMSAKREAQLGATQSFTAAGNFNAQEIVRDEYSVLTAAGQRRAFIMANPGSITSPTRANFKGNKLHDPADGTVFYPLMAWGFDYESNGFRTTERPDHNGLDLQAQPGTEIYSIAAGRVTEAKFGDEYGYYVVIEHQIGGRTVVSTYAHLIELPVVKVGDTVEALELIGNVGSTGKSTGPHLHFAVTVNGVLQDPASWLDLNALR